MPQVQNPLYCAVCKRQVQNVSGQQLINQQVMRLQFSCHGQNDTAFVPIQDLHEGGAIVVFAEYRRVNVENCK